MMGTGLIRGMLVGLALAASAFAGGGPETTLLVVNDASPLSRQVGNLYALRRELAPNHVLYLDSVPHDGVIKLAEFRERIWAPIEAYLRTSGLAGRIDLITYSADFPYAVDFRAAMDGERPGRAVGGQASLTGVTYLIRQVKADEPFWEALRGGRPTQRNRYSRFSFGRVGGNGGARLTGEQRSLYVAASAQMRAGNLAAAAKGYKAFLDVAPQVGQAWVTYAACLVKMGRKAEAIGALETAGRRGFSNAALVESQDALRPLRGDERYQRVIEGMRAAAGGLRPTRGFRSARAWSESGEPTDATDSLHRYYLSTQLAYTGLGGNSFGEVATLLRRSIEADCTNPVGTVYICKNSNVRSTAREPYFAALVSAMKARGRRVKLLDKTILPVDRRDVIGAVVGTASFNWAKSKSVMLPGAICEHLTSFGAHYGTTSQTKISQFLRNGAVGSSGTVQEPLALHVKFPNPMIHAFYADGCTLAEAYYQSVHAPYQLMVAGDGLCQPFAKRAQFSAGMLPGEVKGSVTLAPEGAGLDYELWVDGRPKAALEWDTTAMPDGYHEVEVIAVTRDALETRTRRGLSTVVNNRGAKLSVAELDGPVVFGETIRLKVTGASRFEVYRGSTKVADGAEVASARLGLGLMRLDVRSKDAHAAPVLVEVVLPKRAKALEKQVEPALGLAATIDGETRAIVTTLGSRATGVRLRDQLAGFKRVKTVSLRGAIHVAADSQGSFHQLNVRGSGTVSVRVAGRELCAGASLARQIYLPVALAKGWHALEIDYTPSGAPDLEFLVTGAQVGAPPRIGRPGSGSPQPKTEVGKDGSLIATWKRRPKKPISSVAIIPEKGATLAGGWKLEWRSSTRGKWKPIAAVHELLAPPSQRPPKPKKGEKAKKLPPQALELHIADVKPKQLRLRPPSRIRFRVFFAEIAR